MSNIDPSSELYYEMNEAMNAFLDATAQGEVY